MKTHNSVIYQGGESIEPNLDPQVQTAELATPTQ
jgi:hypothetical protein